MTDTFYPGQKVWVLPGLFEYGDGVTDTLAGRHPGVILGAAKTDSLGTWYDTESPTLPKLPRGKAWSVSVDFLRPRDEPEAGKWSDVEQLTGWNPAKVKV